MRYAIRSIRTGPALAGIAIASLALGIGANLTVYSVVREIVLNDVSARRLDRLVRVDNDISYAVYSGLGLALALVGLYGSVSSAVRRRVREMGSGMKVVLGGIIVGLAAAVAAIRPVVDLLPAGVNPWDPMMFAVVGSFVLLTGALATLAPARRAAALDPSVALRDE